MARITPNTDTTFTTTTTVTTATTIALPENARVLVIDNDTENVTADVNVTDITSLTIGGNDVHVVDHNATNNATNNAASDDDADTDDEDAVFAAAVIAEMLGMLDPESEAEAHADTDDETEAETNDEAEAETEAEAESGNTDTDTDANTDTDTDAATPAITVNRSVNGDNTVYRISINYDSASGAYTDATSDAMIVETHVTTLIKHAYEHNADTCMSFDIPGRGLTTFDGKLQENYGSFTGIVLVAPNGGAYILDDTDCLTDDMMVLSTATFTFKTEDGEDDGVFANFVEAANGEDELFAGLSVNIVDGVGDLGDPNEGNDDDFAEEDYEDDDLDIDLDDDEDEDIDLDDVDLDTDDNEDDDDDASDTANAAPNTTIDPDVKFCATVWANEHFLDNEGIRRVFRYAADHNFSATLSRNLTEDPYVGKLHASGEGDGAIYTLIDKKRGNVKINLDGTGTHTAGFYALTIYSDNKMRRRGFAGTNHEEYAKVSLSEMIERIDDLYDV